LSRQRRSEFILDNIRMWIEEYRFDGASPMPHAGMTWGSHICKRLDTADAAAEDEAAKSTSAESDLTDVRLLLPPQRAALGSTRNGATIFIISCMSHHRRATRILARTMGRRNSFPTSEKTFVLNGAIARIAPLSRGPDADLPGDRFVVCIQNHDRSETAPPANGWAR
jgi:1,4-alpha-glucan branching enzyme